MSLVLAVARVRASLRTHLRVHVPPRKRSANSADGARVPEEGNMSQKDAAALYWSSCAGVHMRENGATSFKHRIASEECVCVGQPSESQPGLTGDGQASGLASDAASWCLYTNPPAAHHPMTATS